MNKIKSENFIPEFVRKTDVTTIYKGKGEKSDLKNDRGIFLITIIRSILMRLIYFDKYEQIDGSMSDSQVGGRKGKNVRNHIWIINGVINDVLSKKSKTPVDLQIFDYKQCFDSLWLEDCMNDMYTAGLKDDKFQLLYNANSIVNVAVKTPVGKTETEDIKNVVLQGDVFAPLLCSKQVDTIGQECLLENKYTYKYKGEVDIPPLSMVDDLICVSECGIQTSMMNSYINVKTNSKKLQFGVEKCKKIHVGKTCDDFKCQKLFVDNWEEVEVRNEDLASISTEDQYLGEEEIEEKKEERYLGDIISKDGRNMKNFQARVNKGKGIVNRIMTRLEAIPFGKYYYEVAMILRDSLLVSSMLTNSEAWYNVTEAELNFLETVDLMLLRSILKAPKATPKEMFFLELGCVPFRDTIRKKRLSFLHYILNEEPSSLVHSFFKKQFETRNKKDWVSTALDDLKKLEINLEFSEIKSMKKTSFDNLLKKCTAQKVLKDLDKLKLSHSKVENLSHKELKMRKYLMPNETNATKEDKILIFKLRCRVTDTKMNKKGLYDDYECDICENENESQKHILECKDLVDMNDENMKNFKYEKLFDGKVCEQLNIAKIFKQNMKNRDEILKQRRNS